MITKIIAGRTFTKVVDNYAYDISKKHALLVVPASEGWEARENKIVGKGSYMEGAKEIKTMCKASGKTLEEAVTKLLEKMETNDPKTAASMRYNETHVKQIKLNLNLKTDADILSQLDKVGNKQGYIKDLIRRDIDGTI